MLGYDAEARSWVQAHVPHRSDPGCAGAEAGEPAPNAAAEAPSSMERDHRLGDGEGISARP
ncbi:hypothetical protein GCM10028775_33480 [Catellatospora paridis]